MKKTTTSSRDMKLG